MNWNAMVDALIALAAPIAALAAAWAAFAATRQAALIREQFGRPKLQVNIRHEPDHDRYLLQVENPCNVDVHLTGVAWIGGRLKARAAQPASSREFDLGLRSTSFPEYAWETIEPGKSGAVFVYYRPRKRLSRIYWPYRAKVVISYVWADAAHKPLQIHARP
ncbi:hypothetical protein SAMN04488020_106117 [Palleronia marisminoris]|uniref:Uncharacterized protein n=1 Tax=Palleronia marisminoris TaxID=315423 RepID=A0A1Y5SXY3_9RHOB|nr:hypothetical protein [Palleronia marisminoris]SFH06691.1 hypothetical protein SAMN04488020_106117 [Palleronia marisminoris]SLN51502.1 hypothetical protein PAM7066_02350 [Palleronia marisminoris]